MTVPELVAPAGDLGKLRFACAWGADAVYGGATAFSMRGRAGNFQLDEMAAGIEHAHRLGKKFYLAANVFLREERRDEFHAFLAEALPLGPDAVILGDIGAVAHVARVHPSTRIHLSTQANVLNADAARAWQTLGVSRIVLAREMSLEGIKRLRDALPDMEYEGFVHGALCVAYAGRCLVSSYLTSRAFLRDGEAVPPDLAKASRAGEARAANDGDCAQTCRWEFQLWEKKREAVALEAEEEDGGTYLLASKDLCMVRHLRDLADAGLCAVKIEGRVKGEHYVAAATGVYREALDALGAGDGPGAWDTAVAADGARWEAELARLTKREHCTGWYFPDNRALEPTRVLDSEPCLYLGHVVAREGGLLRCRSRNALRLGDRIDAVGPGGKRFERIAYTLRDTGGSPVTQLNPNTEFLLETETALDAYTILRRDEGPTWVVREAEARG